MYFFFFFFDSVKLISAESAGAVEYADCFLLRSKTPHAMSVLSMSKPSEGEPPVLKLCRIWSTPFMDIIPRSTSY